MSFPDPRTRSKNTFTSRPLPYKSRPSPWTVGFAHSIHALALITAKALFLNREATTVWLTLRTLQVAAVGAGLWTVVINPIPQWRVPPSLHWSGFISASILLFLQQLSLSVGLHNLSPLRFIIITQTYPFWLPHLLSPTSILSTVLIASSFVFSWLFDASQYPAVLTYGSIVTYVASSYFLQRQQASLIPVVGEWITLWATISGAAAITIPVELLSHVLGRQSQHLTFPWATLIPTLPLLAFTSIHVFYLINRALMSGTIAITHATLPPPRYLLPTFASTFLSAVFISKLGFAIGSSWSDLAVAAVLYIGCLKGVPSGAIDVPTRTGATRTARTYLKVIMENDESRKIFYFLMVNLTYMVIQLLWGFWTNSLGLVSDAIHMFFDCLSVGVGLMASVMANWPPNESFTYGYGRIETISGFANGIFLILISIFIAFEAVQRIIDPPEMGNFKQLLIVSTLGLAVNLFGMFAIGGHHHHGHSHSHSHSHSHAPEPKVCRVATLGTGNVRVDLPALAAFSPAARIILMDMVTATRTKNTITATLTTGTGHLRSAVAVATVIATMGTGMAILMMTILMMTMTTATTIIHSHAAPRRRSNSVHWADQLHSNDSDDHSHSHSHSHSYSSSRTQSGPSPLDFDQSPPSSPTTPNGIYSPITPSYRFEHDAHLDTFHPEQQHKHDDHDHGHSHNMRGVFLHVMADTLGSVGVIISTILIELYGWTGFDPIASLFIAVLIAASVIPLVIDCGKVLCLDIGEKEVEVREALHELSNVDGVASYSEARFWPKDSSSVVGSIHVRLTPSASSYDPTGPHSVKKTSYTNVDRVIDRVDRLLKSKIPGLDDLSIQVEGS